MDEGCSTSAINRIPDPSAVASGHLRRESCAAAPSFCYLFRGSAMDRRQTRPVLIRKSLAALQLEPIVLDPDAPGYDEAFIQELIDQNPTLLPLHQIEPGLPPFRSICREMPTSVGSIDNVLLTANGDVAIVEAKLWRNPEARRKVVAQALDYASCLFELSYEQFEARALKGKFAGRKRPRSLYALFADDRDALDERDFVDAVRRNLQRGRIIVLVVGDGIRSDLERLTGALQSHAGFHFTFALVELGLFRVPGGDTLVVPNTLARTVIVERGIVRAESPGLKISAPPEERPAGTITSEQFFEALAARDPRLPDRVRALIAGMEAIGVRSEFRKALIFWWDGPSESLDLGIITRAGEVWTDIAGGNEPLELSRQYVTELAKQFGGEIDKEKFGGKWHVRLNGKWPRAEQIMDHFEAWCAIARTYVERLQTWEQRPDAQRTAP